MWSEKRIASYAKVSRLFLNLWLFLCCSTYTVFGQCNHGLEPSCVWVHEPSSFLWWKLKGDRRDFYVELTDCNHPKCGIGILQSSWMSARDSEVGTAIEYKIYGTSKVYLRVNLKLEDAPVPHQLFSANGNYAQGHSQQWSTGRVTIPVTHTRYQLLIKAYTPYKEAMVAVKNINLDGTFIVMDQRSSSTSSTTKAATSRSTSRSTPSSTSTTTTTTTITVKPDDDDAERGSDDFNYFPDDDDDEDERRFQSLEIENSISEEDLVKGYTTVVEPEICAYKR